MARWTQTWLSGLGAAGVDTTFGQGPRGVRLGLPADGPGSVPGFGSRSAAFAIDAVLSALATLLLFPVRDLDQQSVGRQIAPVAVLAVLYLVGLLLTGQTLGMRLLRLRVRPVPRPSDLVSDGAAAIRVGLVPAALRTALLMLLVPAVISDRDGRGLHDLAAGTVVVRT